MYPRTWLRRIFTRWTKKGRAARALGRQLGLTEGFVFHVMLGIEAQSVAYTRLALEELRERERQRAAAAAAERRRPENQYTSGARLASPR